MTKTEIIAELRRSAAGDVIPWLDIHPAAYEAAYPYKNGRTEMVIFLEYDDSRTFFLLVAHALEDEC